MSLRLPAKVRHERHHRFTQVLRRVVVALEVPVAPVKYKAVRHVPRAPDLEPRSAVELLVGVRPVPAAERDQVPHVQLLRFQSFLRRPYQVHVKGRSDARHVVLDLEVGERPDDDVDALAARGDDPVLAQTTVCRVADEQAALRQSALGRRQRGRGCYRHGKEHGPLSQRGAVPALPSVIVPARLHPICSMCVGGLELSP
mmetsp:Transcript_21101/g.59606  ORF Transcript_21101/g.59606 Transcript_21101/m.59606 type:complete len:200 (-) Transcript_21101:35-634(-)